MQFMPAKVDVYKSDDLLREGMLTEGISDTQT